MVKLKVSIDEQVKEELFRLVPPRRRSQVVNEALRKELLRRKRDHVTQTLRGLRKRSATVSGEEIMAVVRRDRRRVGE
jgi:metal-responsive CopG/Arc/MetJ family transcriptional regulator